LTLLSSRSPTSADAFGTAGCRPSHWCSIASTASKRSNPTLNAFITVTADLAHEQARNAEREIRAGHWRGPLHGVPVAVKDFYDTAGIRTTAAFERFEYRVPAQDAEIVARLRDAGAVLVGKTNMHKLAMGTTSLDSHFGPVINPWSASHVAGGSSGGSAAAAAAGLCFATIDTDAIGSGRLPAAICGVSCHKPTFGLLSTTGILAGEREDPAVLLLSHPCVTARSVEDVALVLGALTGRAEVKGSLSRSPRRRGHQLHCGRRSEGSVQEFHDQYQEARNRDRPDQGTFRRGIVRSERCQG
jgi:Asp-tRNA(Asn)/Glu-tRNA(Gln) amidotransferase A subunit family amidase